MAARILRIPIPPSPVYDSGEESEDSIQGYPTDIAKDSDDDFSSGSELDVSIPFKKAYKGNQSIILDSDFEVIEALITNHDESDVPFWADQSEDQPSDPELSPRDQWNWDLGFQHPAHCLYTAARCTTTTLPQTVSNQKRMKRRLSRKQRRALQQNSWISLNSSKDANMVQSTSQTTGSCADTMGSSSTEKCIICLEREPNGLIIHGKTAHRVCCYLCARKIEKRSPYCPVCRQSMKVVRQLKKKKGLQNRQSAVVL